MRLISHHITSLSLLSLSLPTYYITRLTNAYIANIPYILILDRKYSFVICQ